MESLLIARSGRAFSTFRILPRSGRTAWVFGSRPWTAEPPAESPSTTKISEIVASREVQSLSLPGMDADSSAPFRRVASRAFRAAIRAAEACWAFRMISRASDGWASSQSPRCEYSCCCTKVRASVLPSFVLV